MIKAIEQKANSALSLATSNSKVIAENTERILTLKRLGGIGEVKLIPPRCDFSTSVSSKERMKPWFFVTFNNILRDIFPENFIEFPHVVQNI